MNKIKSITIIVFLALMLPLVGMAQNSQNETLRVIGFGAHPDDNELEASGVATMWADQGHEVKFVSMTNGDIGHFKQAGGPLAKRRTAEVEECARILGIQTEVLDIHDGELMPTLENRKKVARLIRDWQADIVFSHRRYDYHPDHRYTGELVEDAALVVVAPFFVPDTPPVENNPVFLHYHDGFEKPYPFEPDIVVGIDEVVQKKWDCISAMESQFGDKHSWQASTNPNVPEDEEARKEYLLNLQKQRNEALADQYRDKLIELYGEEKGRNIQYAEAFEVCQYGRTPSQEELKKLFPGFE